VNASYAHHFAVIVICTHLYTVVDDTQATHITEMTYKWTHKIVLYVTFSVFCTARAT